MLSEGRNEAIPVMPFHELADVVGNAVKSVKAELIKNSFKHTLFSLPADGSKDQEEGSKRLNDLIAIAPTFEELPEKYRFEVLCVELMIFFCVVEQVDEFGIRRRKKGNAEKYKKRAFQCKLCKWGHSNKASKKVAEHEENCPAIWIFEDWQPQPLADLKFVKS